MENLLNAIRLYKRNIQNPKDMLFILFVAQIGKHLTEEGEEEGLRKKDIIEFFKYWKEIKSDRPRAIKAFKNYNYSIVPNKIHISERSIHNYIEKMVEEGVLSPPRKKRYKRRKQTFYYFGYLTRHQIKVRLLGLIYGEPANRIGAQLRELENIIRNFSLELQDKYRKTDKKLDSLLSERETMKSKVSEIRQAQAQIRDEESKLEDVPRPPISKQREKIDSDWKTWSKQMRQLNIAIRERRDKCMNKSEKKKRESLWRKIQESQKEYDKITARYDALKEPLSEAERKLDVERNWKKEKQGIISMIEANSWSTTSRQYYGTLIFGIKKPYSELIDHHLDWIHYHTECVADLIHKNGGDSMNFLIVARPSVIIRDDKTEEPFGEYFRDYSKIPRSADWEKPPLPEVILKRLKPSP